MKHVKTVKDFPTGNHFAVIEFENSSVSDDPGNFMASTSMENRTKYISFDTEKELSDYVVENPFNNYVVIHGKPVTVSKKVDFLWKV